MDYLAHTLWTRAIYHKSKHPWWGTFWGVFPDTISWVPFLIYRLFTSGISGGRPSLILPPWMEFLYGFSHSIIIFAVAWLAIYIVKKSVPIYFYGWLFHIFIDVPTHSAAAWPTPFLWPISEYRFNGTSWGGQWFMIANYSGLLLVYIYLVYQRKKNVHGNS